MRTNDVQIEIEKGKEENKKTKISRHQQRKKEERRQHARGIRILQARKERGGGVAPRRNNRIRESATKESREAKVKTKKAIQESNGKRQDERTNERKRNKEWDKEKVSGTGIEFVPNLAENFGRLHWCVPHRIHPS